MAQPAFRTEIWRRVVRTGAAGIGLALAVLLGGLALERVRFGAEDRRALARVEQELRQRFDASAAVLDDLVKPISANRALLQNASSDPAATRRVFEALDSLHADARTGITVYDGTAAPVAWSGRVFNLPRARITGPPTTFVAYGAYGPRLVRVETVFAPERPSSPRIATIVAEQLLGNQQISSNADPFSLTGLFVPVQLKAPSVSLPGAASHPFEIRSRDGTLLVEAHVSPADLPAARVRWRAIVQSTSLAALALMGVLYAALFVELRERVQGWRAALAVTLGLLVTLGAIRFLVLRAVAPLAGDALRSGVELLVDAALVLSLVALTAASIERWRLARPRRPPAVKLTVGVVYLIAGLANVALLWGYERFLQGIVASTKLDPLHFSLHPLTAERLSMQCGLVLLHAAVIWGAALVIRLAGVAWRIPRATGNRVVAVCAWMTGVVAGLVAGGQVAAPIPLLPLGVALAAAAACTAVITRPRKRMRQMSQAARLFGLYVALLIPSIAAYPSMHAFAVQAKENLVATRFGPEAKSLRDDLQRQLEEAQEDIDAVLPSLFDGSAETDSPATNRAFHLWSQTALAQSRLTSSVELFDARGQLLNRFALNLPEYETRQPRVAGCGAWDVFEDVAHVLLASRGICTSGARGRRSIGSVVVRAMLDYRTLPFISPQSPYFESLRPGRTAPEGAPGRDVEFTMYGWSRAPLYVSGTGAWRLSDDVFQRAVDTRVPFWQAVTRGDDVFRVYFLNDRVGIYALSYPVISMFGHVMNLAELVILTGALYVALLILAGVLNALTSRRPASGRALLREVRSSFYRKLFLAFVAVAVVPATILAVATRNRLARQFETGVNETAVKTATVAQRLVEDYAALQRRGGALDGLGDSAMALVGRAIDQDVNLYNGPTLQATSERDLFESGFFPDRTPSDVYRNIVLDRLPTFVSIEDVGGQYLLAAAPVRAAGAERIVTVPQTLRQRELEAQIDELDRQVWSAFVLFVLVGAGLGYWAAERIADPVSRLTRATRRIARGDLDARIAATSSDELRRLVEDFNGMAADLKRQRTELERTQRLEAWADMARQVAHDIKNPLTPIQLSAEHVRRVNMDRGRPLSPALDECVTSILTQVSLLRQIAAEFSSFGSSPIARPEPVDLAAATDEVVEPYRAGLAGRVAIDVTAEAGLPSVVIDQTLFSRAVINIIENALHAMPGTGRLSIASRRGVHEERASAFVTIADTGVGMDPEAMARIFEPYFSTKATGTGLGLTIAKRNVELNGGQIVVESQRGVGTTVTIILPLPMLS